MKKHFCILNILLTVTLLSACSSTGSKYYRVRNETPRISSLGFYISPPPGGNWYEKHHEDSLYYFKRTKSNHYALSTRATELSFDDENDLLRELLEYINRQDDRFHQGRRYKNYTHRRSPVTFAAGQCVEYQFNYDDYGNMNKGDYPFVKVFNKGLVCKHPLSPQVGIDLNYTEQSLPAVQITSYRNEGERFLESLHFYAARN